MVDSFTPWCVLCEAYHHVGEPHSDTAASRGRTFAERNAEFAARAREVRRQRITVQQLLDRWKAENVSGYALSIRNAVIELVEGELTAMVDGK